ncbi:mono/diheme cytochrome c family protein [Neobacillus niacini]|uniref:cytochrome c551 n=1 Tax=Neobacillus niacini TaxID=86668 RepID=UPI002861CB13|nr:cytochrome c [Neobacillus niacini]MDR7078328.1 mono/diheme cytochrome c family protein [Neobacillus niacini]
MKKWLYGIICVAFLGFITACGGGDEATEKDTTPTKEQEQTADAGDGDALFQQSCSSCHGGDLVSGGAPDLDKVGSKYSKDEIEEIIVNGKGGMPGGILTGEDADAVASWLSEKK